MRDLYVGFFGANPKITLIGPSHVVETGDVALPVGRWSIEMAGEDGSPTSLTGVYTTSAGGSPTAPGVTSSTALPGRR